MRSSSAASLRRTNCRDDPAFDELSARDQSIVREARDGRLFADIARDHGISRPRVSTIVSPFISLERRSEIRETESRIRSDERVEMVFALHRAKLPMRDIARQLGVHIKTARRALYAHPDYKLPERKDPAQTRSRGGRQPKRDAAEVEAQALALMAQGLSNTAVRGKLSLHNERVREIRERFERATPAEVPAWVWPENRDTYREIAALPDDEDGGEEAAAAWARRQQCSQRAVADALAAREAR